MNDKETGSFYTPKELIEYMVTYTSARIKPKTILEPSAGDGRFVEPLKKFNAQISLVEFDPMKAASLSSTFAECCTVHCTDFIKYANQCGEKYKKQLDYSFIISQGDEICDMNDYGS